MNGMLVLYFTNQKFRVIRVSARTLDRMLPWGLTVFVVEKKLQEDARLHRSAVPETVESPAKRNEQNLKREIVYLFLLHVL
jgi:hypothetical protein